MSILERGIDPGFKTEAQNKSFLSFQDYWANGGTLNEEVYETVLDEASQNHPINEITQTNFNSLVRNSNLMLKDQISTANLYNVLRRDVVGGSDQKILAEALKMAGDMDALDQLVEFRKHISDPN